MNERHSLLNKIKSRNIIKKILNYAFPNIKSVFKFDAYDKVLLKKLDINIKDYYYCEVKENIKKEQIFIIQASINLIILFIPLLIYYILLYTKGVLKSKNLKIGFNKKKKNFIVIFDNILILLFIIYLIMSFRLSILIDKGIIKKVFSRKDKIIIEIFNFFIFLFYLIMSFIKLDFIDDVIDCKSSSRNNWYFVFNSVLIFFLFLSFGINLKTLFLFLDEINQFSDEKFFILNKINGLKIRDYTLPLEFNKLNEKDKLKMLFKEENMKKYRYVLDNAQKELINKINKIRKQNNIKELKYDILQQIPDYIINNKTELIFYKDKNVYEFSNNYYLIKYPISETQKEINDKNIINIIKIDFLDSINIIRKDNYEYILLYKNNHNNKKSNIKVGNGINKINPKLNPRRIQPFKIFEADDILNKNKREKNLSETQKTGVQDNDRSENIIIGNMEKNINIFEKLKFEN